MNLAPLIWEGAFILNMIATILLAVALYRHLESHRH
jgi:hypothetical protein